MEIVEVLELVKAAKEVVTIFVPEKDGGFVIVPFIMPMKFKLDMRRQKKN